MKQTLRRYTRIFILSLLAVSVFVPIVLLSGRLRHHTSDASEGFVEDLSSIKYRTDTLKLSAIEKDESEGLKEPTLVLYKAGDINSLVRFSSSDDNVKSEESTTTVGTANLSERNGTNYNAVEDKQQHQQEKILPPPEKREQLKGIRDHHDQSVRSDSRRVIDEKVEEMKDQLIRAKAYLSFAPSNSNSHLVKELKLRIKEVERVVDRAAKDSDLSKSCKCMASCPGIAHTKRQLKKGESSAQHVAFLSGVVSFSLLGSCEDAYMKEREMEGEGREN